MTPPPSLPHLGLVVEGRGEIQAVPALLRKRLEEKGDYRDIVGKPVPCNGRFNALRPRGIEGYVAVAAARPGCRGVLVVLDGEGDAVCELGPELAKRASQHSAGKEVVTCLADAKYEDWLVSSAESLELPNLAYRPEADAVKVLREALHPIKYVKPIWQPKLTYRMSLDLAASRNQSLARFLRKFDALVESCLPD